ncbi:unnamed protein product [Paramecium pentaurelia]|uniref:Uncharacterized protein n=1 Tax=Paramecium pentaurelia TaxID=43138 RepID=A0A8S1T8Y3_9CILI|nr:unnamed protein product [Paramecium pentaurelia]
MFLQYITITIRRILKVKNIINLDEFLLDVAITEVSDLQFTEHDYQNNLTKQKGNLDYLGLIQSLVEQMIDLERINLQSIEKEFGELLIEETDPLSLTERIMKNLYYYSIEFSLKIINNENQYQNYLNIEKENYVLLLKQLRKVNCQENCQVVEQLFSKIYQLLYYYQQNQIRQAQVGLIS